MAEIAFLVFNKKLSKGRRANQSFDGQSNIGAYVIKDVLERARYSIDFVCPEFIDRYKIVLVSLTSSYDIINFLSAIKPLKSWKNRKCKIIIGGPGVQNIYSIREYIDFAVFGRGEKIIVSLIESILKNKEFLHESVMNLKDGITPVKFCQAEELYPYEIPLYPIPYREVSIGCRNKCLFCHYTFVRNTIEIEDRYLTGFKYSKSSEEFLFKELLQKIEYKGKWRTAIDGFSERLRFVFNKRISDEQIINTIEELSLRWQGEKLWLYIYMIGNYPTETEKDIKEFRENLRQVEIKGKPVFVNLHVSLFRPSPLTPSAYLPVNIETDWRKKDHRIITKKNFVVSLDYTRESLYGFFQTVIIERATEDSDDLINTILFSRNFNKLSVDDKMVILKKRFDLSQYTREYSTDERLPSWYLESYIPNEKIKKMADILKKRLKINV